MVGPYTTRKTTGKDFGKQEHIRDEEPSDRNYGHLVVSDRIGPLEIVQLKISISVFGAVRTECMKNRLY